jgi:hypothetical protein
MLLHEINAGSSLNQYDFLNLWFNRWNLHGHVLTTEFSIITSYQPTRMLWSDVTYFCKIIQNEWESNRPWLNW